jgi:hypothetical protein
MSKGTTLWIVKAKTVLNLGTKWTLLVTFRMQLFYPGYNPQNTLDKIMDVLAKRKILNLLRIESSLPVR